MLTIYKASAGSGKTYTLAYSYIKLLLGVKQANGTYVLNCAENMGGKAVGKRHRHILAITFTNKATEEMKTRIVNELTLLAAEHGDGTDSNYAPALMSELNTTRQALRQAADKALKDLLFDYHHFNVSTIDSFFQTVLRAFAREVDHQGDYGVELSDEFAVASGIGMMLDDLNYGYPAHRTEMMRWINNFTMQIAESGRDASLFNRSGSILKKLARYVQKMGNETFKKHSDEVLAYLAEPERIKRFTDQLQQRIEQNTKQLRDAAMAVEESFRATGHPEGAVPGALWRMVRCAAEGEEIKMSDFSLATVKKLFDYDGEEEPAFYVKKYCGTAKRRNYPPEAFSRQLQHFAMEAQRAMVENHSLKKIAEACPNLQFLGFTWQYIKRFRDENNLILLSDTHDLLQRIIGRSETPFIYEKIGEQLRHFLIDEFQDTSHMQWHNLKPLVADSLAAGNDNLIIGDEKQAIYRFRNSDSSLLHHTVAKHDFPTQHLLRGQEPQENTNRRSAEGIVRFNNALFTRLARQTAVEGYENTVQEVDPRKADETSYITLHDTSQLPQENGYPAEFELTAKEIERQHAAGYRWRDITVLVRRRSEAEEFVNYLLQFHPGVKVMSDEALLLRNSPAIKLVISMLKIVNASYTNDFDPTALKTDGTPTYATNADIRLITSRYHYELTQGLTPQQAIDRAIAPRKDHDDQNLRSGLAGIRKARPGNLLTLVETIIHNELTPTMRQKEFAFLAAFVDVVIDYCTQYNPSTHAFLQWWAEASDHLAVTGGAEQDAVTVMTVHKSKGLQSACIHIPFGDWELTRRSDSVWLRPDMLGFVEPELVPPLISVEVDAVCGHELSPLRHISQRNRAEQMSDNLNVSYVAYTRAERELNVCFGGAKAMGAQVFEALAAAPLLDGSVGLNLPELYDAGGERYGSGTVFVYGAPTTPKKKTEETATDNESGLTIGDYRAYFRTDLRVLTTVDDITSNMGEIMDEVEDNEAAEGAKKTSAHKQSPIRDRAALRGTHLHAIMADLPASEPLEALPAVVKRAAQRYSLSHEEVETYTKIVTDALHDAGELVQRWFRPDAEVRSETGIYCPNTGETLRPDRIVMHSNGEVDVVDYKFTAAPKEENFKQVRYYVSLLNQMGYKRVRGFLWYLELNLVEEV